MSENHEQFIYWQIHAWFEVAHKLIDQNRDV